MPQSLLHKHLHIWLMKIKFLAFGRALLLCACCLSILLVNSPIRTEATAPTNTYYATNELYLTGTLYRVGSQYGTPVNDLTGTNHTIYLNAESERCLVIGDAGQYLSNQSSTTATGYLDIGYQCQIPYADCLWVKQDQRTNNTTREGWVYYEVIVDDIQTNLLYRPERNDRYITILCAGAVLFGLITILKVVRRD